MTNSKVTSHGPHVYRSVRATWTIRNRWGPILGDTTEYTVAKNDGNKRVHVSGLSGRGNESWPVEAAREIGEALIAAADWSDDTDDKDSGGKGYSSGTSATVARIEIERNLPDNVDYAIRHAEDGFTTHLARNDKIVAAIVPIGVARAGLGDLDTSKVTRVEVINETGRAFVQGPSLQMQSLVKAVLQDEGRTLKVFINPPFDTSRAVGLTDTERLSGVVEQGEEATGLKQDLRASGNDVLNRAREQDWPAEDGPVLKPYARAGVQTAQTRHNDGEILSWVSVTEAFEYAGPDEDVWKISFNDSDGRRVRLVRTTDEDGEVSWLYRPMEREIAEGLERERSHRAGREDESSNDRENPSTVVLPPGTVRRAPADGGHLLHRHAILLDGGVSSRRWHIVSLFGPEDSMRTDSDVAHWPIVYIPKPNDVWAQEES